MFLFTTKTKNSMKSLIIGFVSSCITHVHYLHSVLSHVLMLKSFLFSIFHVILCSQICLSFVYSDLWILHLFYFICLGVCLYIWMCATWVSGNQSDQKMVLKGLGLVLWIIVKGHVCAGTWTWILCKCSRCSDSWTTSSVLHPPNLKLVPY